MGTIGLYGSSYIPVQTQVQFTVRFLFFTFWLQSSLVLLTSRSVCPVVFFLGGAGIPVHPPNLNHKTEWTKDRQATHLPDEWPLPNPREGWPAVFVLDGHANRRDSSEYWVRVVSEYKSFFYLTCGFQNLTLDLEITSEPVTSLRCKIYCVVLKDPRIKL